MFPPWLPADVVRQLDPRDFEPYDAELAAEADALSQRFGVFIATYSARPPTEGPFRHLCRTFEAASLSVEAIDALREAEHRHRAVTFVAYAKPLQRRT